MVGAGRPKSVLVLSTDERETLERWARRPKSAQALALRCRIVLACARGGNDIEVAARLGVNRATVGKWRRRFIAQRLSSSMGQQFIVENKPGAGGAIGTAAGVNSPADGYTLTLIAAAYLTYPGVYKLKFDPITDITPIIQISQGLSSSSCIRPCR